jgi:peptidyl-prolyl cis-trans isomerase D
MLATYFQSSDNYRDFLSGKGLSASQFQEELRGSLKREALNNLVTAAMVPSIAEVRALTVKSLTKFSGNIATFSPADFEAKVPAPSDAELETFFTSNASRYEEAAKVKYSFAKITRDNVANLIEITPDMVAIYYTDHSGMFRIYAGTKVKQLGVEFNPANADEKAKAKSELEKVRKELIQAKNWDAFASKLSDKKSKATHTDLGWVAPNQLEQSLSVAAAAAKIGEPTEIIEGTRGMYVILVEGRREEGIKPLNEVSDEIRSRILAEEAPSYIASLGEEMLEKLQKGAELSTVTANKAAVVTISDFNAADPEGLPGLKSKIIEDSKDKYQIHHLPTSSVLVRIDELKDPEIPGLAAIKEKLLADYRKEKSVALAESVAKDFANSIKSIGDLEKLTKEKGGKVQAFTGATSENAGPALQVNEELRTAVLDSIAARILPGTFNAQGSFAVAEVSKIEKPSAEEVEKNIKRFETQAQEKLARLQSQALVKKLRSEATINVSPRLEAE